MNQKHTVLDPNYDTPHRTGICWSAIWSGAFVGLGLGFLLQLFGIAIGLSAYQSSSTGANTIAIGGLLGLLIGVIASMGVAGFVSGYLGRFHFFHCNGGVIYGFLTWSLALLLSAILLLPLSHYASSYVRGISPNVSVTENIRENVNISVDKNAANQTTQANVKMSPEALAGSSWVVFILFFIGALSSCIGACIGMDWRRRHHHVEESPRV